MQPIFANYHTHSRYDDGKEDLSAYVRRARELGHGYLGFSGHAPMDIPSTWLMSRANLALYLEDFRKLVEGATPGPRLFCGLEADYLRGVQRPSRALAPGLDYVIGSVHYLVAPAPGDPGWTIDGPPEEIDRGCATDFGGDMRELVEAYYGAIIEMVSDTPPDIVGHIDLIRKNNRRGERFSEEAPWYRAAALGALEACRDAGCVVEVNTGGLIRGTTDTVYPSPWLLAECRRLAVPLVVSSDAHRPEHLDGYFDRALALMREAGYRARVVLTEDGWIPQPI